jgi:hypothetical protein
MNGPESRSVPQAWWPAGNAMVVADLADPAQLDQDPSAEQSASRITAREPEAGS